jgi:hypothetical protein
MERANSAKTSTVAVSRRTMLQRATVGATAIALSLTSSNANAQCIAQSPIDYGVTAGHPLTDQNISRLFAAWLVLTTNAPDRPTVEILMAVANVGQATAKSILEVYTNANCQNAFKTVREAFGCLAYSFAASMSPYSGGQCPEKIDRINPVTTLDATTPASHCAMPHPSVQLHCPDCFPADLKVKFKEAAKQVKADPKR